MRRPKTGKFKKNRLRFWKIMLPVVLLAFIVIKSDSLILAKNLECYTQFGTCPENIVAQLQWLINYPLLRPLPTVKVRRQLQQFAEIKSVSLYRRLPRTLILSLLLRKPIGTVGPQVLGMHAIADEDGLIIGQSDKLNLPLLIDDVSFKPGEKLQTEKLQALKMLNQLANISRDQLIGKISGSDLTIYISQTTSVLLNLANLAPDWYATLQVILDRSKILDKIPKVIDLRFSSPTITF